MRFLYLFPGFAIYQAKCFPALPGNIFVFAYRNRYRNRDIGSPLQFLRPSPMYLVSTFSKFTQEDTFGLFRSSSLTARRRRDGQSIDVASSSIPLLPVPSDSQERWGGFSLFLVHYCFLLGSAFASWNSKLLCVRAKTNSIGQYETLHNFCAARKFQQLFSPSILVMNNN